MAARKGKQKEEQAVVTLGPQVREGLSLIYFSILSINFKVRMSLVLPTSSLLSTILLCMSLIFLDAKLL